MNMERFAVPGGHAVRAEGLAVTRSASGGVHTELLAPDQCPGLEADWTTLAAAHGVSPFSSWAWVSTWLRNLPADVSPRVFRARDPHGVLALGVIVSAPERGIGRLFGRRSLLLQETGDPMLDEITIEYAGLLVRDNLHAQAYRALFSHLGRLPRDWRRLRIGTTAQAAAIDEALPAAMRAHSTLARPCYHVDLAQLRAAEGGYADVLGRKARGSLRQTLRAYDAIGPLSAEVAGDAVTARTWFDELEGLHTRYWQSRGRGGCFASPFFGRFHRDLIADPAHEGLVRITRITAGDVLVGYLYNLQWNGTVYYYNGGLNYGILRKHDRPGIASLHAAIVHAAAEGLAGFDFLAGEQEYKRRLATGSRTLHSIDVRVAGPRMAVEKMLARASRRGTFGMSLADALASDVQADVEEADGDS